MVIALRDGLGCARANWRKWRATVRQLAGPVRVCVVHQELREHDFGDAVEHCGIIGDVPGEHHRISAHCVAEAAHGQSIHTVAIDDRQRSLQDHRPAELIAVLARRRRRAGHRCQHPRRTRSAASSWPQHFPFCSAASSSTQHPEIVANMVVQRCRSTLFDSVDLHREWGVYWSSSTRSEVST